jgi:hypothetical protein
VTWSDRYTLELKGNYSQNPKRVRFSRGTVLRRKEIRKHENPNETKKVYELAPIRMFRGGITHSPLPFSINLNQTVLGVDIGQDLSILLATNRFVFLFCKIPVPFKVVTSLKLSVQFTHLCTTLPHPKAAVRELGLAHAMSVMPGGTQVLENVCSIKYISDVNTILTDVIEVIDWRRGQSVLAS